MAVVQISKIQLRRGRKLTTGLPQLASGELAWAIDTQELYIGNGAIGEGAPAVGNTKVLTEKDNILDLVAQYQYKYDSDLNQSIIVGTIKRSLQSRLDDGAVNANNFGIIPSVSIDQTELIQSAIYSLFLRTPEDRVTLEFDPGNYKFTNTIYIPSNVSIKGSGKDKTIFNFVTSANNPVAFEFINESSTSTDRNVVPTTFSNQPKNIVLTDFTVTTASKSAKIFDFVNVKNSELHNIKLVGAWDKTDGLLENSKALDLRAPAVGVVCQKNKFSNIDIEKFSYGAFAASDVEDNLFEGLNFKTMFRAVSFGETAGALQTGPSNNIISSCTFELISKEGIVVAKGSGNISKTNTFKNVGSDEGGFSNNVTAIIRFDTPGNSSIGDVFDRAVNLSRNNFSSMYIPEIQGTAQRQEVRPATINLTTAVTPAQAFRLPINLSNSFEIDYVYQSTAYNQMRKGTLHIAVDTVNDNVQLVDEYEYIGEADQDSKIIFTASLGVSATQKHLIVFYTNLNAADINTFTYTLKSLS
jgi:hypothetical protein